MNYFYYHPAFMVSNASNPVFTPGQKLDGSSTYVYDPSKDIIHIALTSNKKNTFDYNPVTQSGSYLEVDYSVLPTWYREYQDGIGADGTDIGSDGNIFAPWDYIIFAPEDSTIQSGVYKYDTAGSNVRVYWSGSGGPSSYWSDYTPINISSPTRISEITYNSNGMHAYPPDDRGGNIVVTLTASGHIGFGGFYDTNPGTSGSNGWFGGSSSYDPHPGIQFRSGSYSIRTFDVNGLETDTFHNLQGQITAASPDKVMLMEEGISASNHTVESDKITLRGKDSEGNTIVTTEKYIEKWPEPDLSLYQETNYPQIGNVAYYRKEYLEVEEHNKTVTVQLVNGSNKYFIDGVQQDNLDLTEGELYPDGSGTTSLGYIINYPSAHPLRFSTTPDGTHGGGSEYTTGVTHNSSTQLRIIVDADTPTLYYYCSAHSGMGGTARTA